MRRGNEIALIGAIGVMGGALLACVPSGSVAQAPAAPPVAAEAPPIPLASDAAADSLLVELVSVIPGLRTDIRYATPANFTGSVLDGYEAPRAYLRWEAALALGRVERRLAADGLALLVYDAYRPVRASVAMVRWAEAAGQLRLIDDGYVARRSRHNMGVAIDVALVSISNDAVLQMGTAYDAFEPAAHTANATGVVAQHRRRLVQAMEAEGFRNYAQEWWHFSFEVPDARPFDRPIGRVAVRVP